MNIDIYSDTVCPWCYVGKQRLTKALTRWQRTPVSINWRAFQLNPDMPPDGMDRQTYLSLKFGGDARANQIYSLIVENGQRENIPFKFDRIARTPNTVDSHRLARLAARAGRQDEVVEAMFQAYFVDGIDIGDKAELVRIADGAGLDGPSVASYLETDQDVADVLAEDRRARRLGIEGVPCFIINGRYALSGAQEPEAFVPLFELAGTEAAPDTPTFALT